MVSCSSVETPTPLKKSWNTRSLKLSFIGEEPKFEFEYLITFLVSLIIAALVAFAQFVIYPLPEGGQLLIFAIGLGVGIGSNTLINEAKKWFFPNED
jgi:hypothetical protein